MISCGVSPTESRHVPEPASGVSVLLLTHRRGCVVIAFQRDLLEGSECSPEKAIPPRLLAEVAALSRFDFSSSPLAVALIAKILKMQLAVCEEGNGPFFLGSETAFSLALSFSTTAEHLADMYLASIARLGSSDRDVAEVFCGLGPGSFTGLRIGCAFANGLHAGRKRLLWGVPCHTLASLRNVAERCGLAGEWFQDFSVLDAGRDESFARVGLLDAVMGVVELVGPRCERDEILEPKYGKEPGPVIKLRSQMQGNLV